MRAAEAAIPDTVTLRPLTDADITPRYLDWFHDERVTRYLEARNISRQDALDHLHHGQRTGTYFLYAITVAGVHIGNLKLGPIQHRHGLSDLVTVIGDSAYWGHGYGTEAIRQGMQLAWDMGIRKLSVGIYGSNTGSLKAYTRAGFTIEATLHNHYLLAGQPQDRLCLSAFHPQL